MFVAGAGQAPAERTEIMSLADLVSIDYDFDIPLSNISVNSSDLEKIQKAWAAGHFIYWDTQGFNYSDMRICVFSVVSRVQAHKGASDITASWSEISKMLSKGEIPDEWVHKAINGIEKRMEEWL